MTNLTYCEKNPALFRSANGSWNKSGKVYDTLGKLRSTITYTMNSLSHIRRNEIHDWEFVEYEVTVKEVKDLFGIVDKKKVWELLQR